MTQRLSNGTWLARLRAAFPWPRARHYADLSKAAPEPAPKLEPISKILANAGRDPAAPVD